MTTCDNENVQSDDQEEGNLNITINANSGAHDKTIKGPLNKNNVTTIKSK